eukprot:TRINITY_DN4412_c0_g1_i2.p1 TRINITY_DN4412_c0_g1~~TRINITY_DN4412_c0_g1_i2.p1  ORF type:complete len:984 (+),score=89.47 TRINITY_DN4412_c0_g1_i2:110-3061(+)
MLTKLFVVQCMVWLVLVSCISLSQTLLISNMDSFEYDLGSFVVKWDQEQREFSVGHKDYEDAVFSSVEQEAFVSLGVGPSVPATTIIPSAYQIKGNIKCVTTTQSIEEVSQEIDNISIRGSLDLNREQDQSASISVGYEFILNLRNNRSVEFEFQWFSDDNNTVKEICGGVFNTVYLRLSSYQDELFYGLGLQVTSLLHNGRKIPIISQEQGVTRGLEPWSSLIDLAFPGVAGDPVTTYSAVPYTMSSNNRSLLIYDNLMSIFDFTNVPTPEYVSSCQQCNQNAGTRDQVTSAIDDVCGEQTNIFQLLGLLQSTLGINTTDPVIQAQLLQVIQSLNTVGPETIDEVIAYLLPNQDDSAFQCKYPLEEGKVVFNRQSYLQLNEESILNTLKVECPKEEAEETKDDEEEECVPQIFNATQPQVIIQISAVGTDSKVGGLLIQARDALNVIEEYTSYAGRMNPLPQWSYYNGAIIAITGGSENVLQKYNYLRSAGVPISGLWIQDWCGLRDSGGAERVWWNWQLDRSRYPDWEDLVQKMNDENVKILLYASPYVANVVARNAQVSQQCRNAQLLGSGISSNFEIKIQKNLTEGATKTIYEQALELGYLVKSPGQDQPYILYSGEKDFTFGLIDFTNPDAKEWYAQVIATNILGIGAAGFMADFAEGLPLDTVLYDNSSSAFVHNKYPELWSEVSKRAFQLANISFENGFFFSRSAGTQSPQNVPLFWLGDQVVSWDEFDGLKSVVTGLLTGGFQGFALMQSDVGGYTMIDQTFGPIEIKFLRSKELLYRWAELGALSDVIMRTHIGNLPHLSHQVWSDFRTAKDFAFLVGLHISFADYRKDLMQITQDQGLPLVRHPVLHYPQIQQVSALRWQFMLGEDVMVCPALDEGIDTVECFLPNAVDWVPMWILYGAQSQDLVEDYNAWIQGKIAEDGSQGGVWITAPAQNLCPVVFFKNYRSQSLSNIVEYLQSQSLYANKCMRAWKRLF